MAGPSVEKDDISFFSDDEDEASPYVTSRLGDAPLNPQRWSNVDEEKLRQQSLRIVRRLFSNIRSPASRQGSPFGEQFQDFPSMDSSSRRRSTSPTTHGRRPAPLEDPVRDPYLQAAELYKNVPWSDLVKGLQAVRKEVNDHAGILKALVKSNFDGLLKDRDAVEDIALRLNEMKIQQHVGDRAAMPADVEAGIHRSLDVTHGMYESLLERHQQWESIMSMVDVLKEQDVLVSLPSQVRRSAENRDFPAVLALYHKAMKVVTEQKEREETARSEKTMAVWEKLKSEIEKAMSFAVHILLATVENSDSGPTNAGEAAMYLLQLQRAQVPATARLDVLALFTRAQERGALSLIENAVQEASSLLGGNATSYERKQQAAPLRASIWQMAPSTIRNGNQTDETILQLFMGLIDQVTQWVTEFWEVISGTERFAGWPEVVDGDSKSKVVLERVLDVFEGKVAEIGEKMLESDKEGDKLIGGESSVSLVAIVVSALDALKRTGAPPMVVKKFEMITLRLARDIAESIEASAVRSACRLSTDCTWNRTSVDRLPEAAVTLRLTIFSCLNALIRLQGEYAKTKLPNTEIPVSKPVQAIVIAFVQALVEQAGSLKGPQGEATVLAFSDRSLLEAWAVLERIGDTLFSQSSGVWEVLVPSSKGQSKEQDMRDTILDCRRCIGEASNVLVRQYLEHKLARFDAIMEQFLSIYQDNDEKAARHLDGAITGGYGLFSNHVRPVTWSLLVEIGALRSELQLLAPSLSVDLVYEVLEGVSAGLSEFLKSGVLRSAPIDNIHQLLLDVSVVARALEELYEQVGSSATVLLAMCQEIEKSLAESMKKVRNEQGLEPQQWTYSIGDHRRLIDRLCTSELDVVAALLKPIRPSSQKQ